LRHRPLLYGQNNFPSFQWFLVQTCLYFNYREGPPRQAPPLSPIIKRELIYVYKNSCNKKKSSKNKSARSNSARPSSAEPGKCNQRSVTPSNNYGSFQNLSYQPMYQSYQQSYGSQAYLPGFLSYPSYPQFYY